MKWLPSSLEASSTAIFLGLRGADLMVVNTAPSALALVL